MVFLDAIHYHVRENNIVVKKAVYIALGYNLEGFKKILGLLVGENESSKYWLLVLNGLKERGLEDVLIFSTDNLPGFSEAIEAVYPRSEIHPKSVGKIMYNTSNKILHKVCILQRHKRINERPKSSIQDTNRRLSLNKFRSL
uniref:transposase n=1 Tax=Anaerococcus urinomassiliensis TaxID=1745712 RepID=UPI000A920C16|nr:transposase [Anaerococcus urinomassiliensis]